MGIASREEQLQSLWLCFPQDQPAGKLKQRLCCFPLHVLAQGLGKAVPGFPGHRYPWAGAVTGWCSSHREAQDKSFLQFSAGL